MGSHVIGELFVLLLSFDHAVVLIWVGGVRGSIHTQGCAVLID